MGVRGMENQCPLRRRPPSDKTALNRASGTARSPLKDEATVVIYAPSVRSQAWRASEAGERFPGPPPPVPQVWLGVDVLPTSEHRRIERAGARLRETGGGAGSVFGPFGGRSTVSQPMSTSLLSTIATSSPGPHSTRSETSPRRELTMSSALARLEGVASRAGGLIQSSRRERAAAGGRRPGCSLRTLVRPGPARRFEGRRPGRMFPVGHPGAPVGAE